MADAHFSWHELLTTDPTAAIGFYSKVIGWTTEAYDGIGQPYTMWKAGEAPIGGVMELPEEARAMGAPPHWMGYVSVDDAAATVAKAASLGGKAVVPPFEVPTVGTIAVLSDPQGAYFSVLQPETAMPPSPPAQGHMSWCELMTPDPEGAFAFYGEIFGWKKHSEMDMGAEAGMYHMLGSGESPFGGVYKPPQEQAPPAWLYYAMVDSADAACARVKEAGGQVVHGPMEVPGGDRVAICTDPQGAAFAVHSKGAG